MRKLNIWRWPVLVALLAFLFWPALSSAAFADPDHVTLTWTGDPKTTQTITWRTDIAVTGGQVRYVPEREGKTPPQPTATVVALTETWQTNAGDINIHSVTLANLLPGVRYRYQVGNGVHWSGEYTFQTELPQSKPFGFFIFADSQSIDYSIWRATLQAAAKAGAGAAFMISLGDLVDVGQDYAEWEQWFAAAAGVIDHIPVMPVTGNHECYTPERRFSPPVYFTRQFFLPENGPAGMKRQVYSFDYGDVHFAVLDSQAGEQSRFIPDMLERQREWLEADLAATDKKWKVVLMHRPVYGNKPDRINENLQQAFVDIFSRQRVDLVFAGHDHVYARTVPMDRGGDGLSPADFPGTVHVTAGRTGSKTYSNVAGKEWNMLFYNPVDEPLYLFVRAGNEALRVQAWRIRGELIDEWALEK